VAKLFALGSDEFPEETARFRNRLMRHRLGDRLALSFGSRVPPSFPPPSVSAIENQGAIDNVEFFVRDADWIAGTSAGYSARTTTAINYSRHAIGAADVSPRYTKCQRNVRLSRFPRLVSHFRLRRSIERPVIAHCTARSNNNDNAARRRVITSFSGPQNSPARADPPARPLTTVINEILRLPTCETRCRWGAA